MLRGLLMLAVTAGILLGATAAAAMPTTEPLGMTDPIGDSGTAPDIAAVIIGEPDDLPGTALIGLGLLNFPPSGDGSVTLWLDTDKDTSTGSSAGNEYALAVDNVGGYSWGFQRWNGTTFEAVAPSPAIQVLIEEGTVIWSFTRADIGNAAGFRSYVVSVLAASPTPDSDRAPDGGSWSFDFGTATRAVKPVIGPASTTPRQPVAGKRFTVLFRVTRSDTGAPLTTGTMVSDPSISAKTLPHTQSFKGGRARLTMRVPKTAKGKRLKVRVRITVKGQSATRVAVFRVR